MGPAAPFEYDPYSHEAMSDAHPLYARLRAQSRIHYMPRYDAWAFAGFEEIWKASLDFELFSAAGGQTPGQVLLGEPIPHTFMTMDPPRHRIYRGLIADAYSRRSIESEKPRMRALVRELLAPLAERGEFEVYTELANRVTTINAAHMAGVPRSDAETLRRWIDGFLARERGQVGTSARNAECAARLGSYLAGLVAESRRHPERATGHLATWLTAEVEGRKLTDEEVVANLYSLVVTGSETTPLSVAATLRCLFERPAQLAAVRADPALVVHAFSESLRFDHPTNVLTRRVGRDAVFFGQDLREGQGVLFLYASANRDEREFPDADVYDIARRPRRTLSFGHGIHKCLGEHVGMALGCILLEEVLATVAEYEVDLDACERLYGEFLSGWCRVPIRFRPTRLAGP